MMAVAEKNTISHAIWPSRTSDAVPPRRATVAPAQSRDIARVPKDILITPPLRCVEGREQIAVDSECRLRKDVGGDFGDLEAEAGEPITGAGGEFEVEHERLELDIGGDVFGVVEQPRAEGVERFDIQRCRIGISHGGTNLHRG
jgi:hypothetical protein